MRFKKLCPPESPINLHHISFDHLSVLLNSPEKILKMSLNVLSSTPEDMNGLTSRRGNDFRKDKDLSLIPSPCNPEVNYPIFNILNSVFSGIVIGPVIFSVPLEEPAKSGEVGFRIVYKFHR